MLYWDVFSSSASSSLPRPCFTTAFVNIAVFFVILIIVIVVIYYCEKQLQWSRGLLKKNLNVNAIMGKHYKDMPRSELIADCKEDFGKVQCIGSRDF